MGKMIFLRILTFTRKEPRMRSLLELKKGIKSRKRVGVKVPGRDELKAMGVDGRVELIRSLIPLGLMAVSEMLEEEILNLSGQRHSRGQGLPGLARYGYNPGSIYLAGQKVPIRVPRIRNLQNNSEVPLESYHKLNRNGIEVNDLLLRRVLYGLSCRDYEAAAESIPGAFGLSSSTVSREFIKASSSKLKEIQGRDLSQLDVIAMFIDGKSFAEDEMVLALGVTMLGEKVILGFTQTATENQMAISDLLNDLLSRGLNMDCGLLVIIDGSKGIYAGVRKAFKGKCVIQRCQWHKRENIISYLPKKTQTTMRKRLQRAYNKPTIQEAESALATIRKELSLMNQSALKSLEEGLEETLTLHRLNLFPILGESLKTTNCIESIFSGVQRRCGKVSYWKNSNQKQRWFGTALLDAEPRLRRIKGYRHLNLLREKIMRELKIIPKEVSDKIAA